MEIKVTKTEVQNTSICFTLDLTITHNGEEKELQVSVEYEDVPNFGSTETTWDIVGGDDEFLEKHELLDEFDDFIGDYVFENIGKF